MNTTKQHGPGFFGGNALRQRCPVCKKRRRCASRKGWSKLDGRWVCAVCTAKVAAS